VIVREAAAAETQDDEIGGVGVREVRYRRELG
jgi:hypothetical protein